MNGFRDTQAIFAQLAASPAEGSVAVLIANHEAWGQNGAALEAFNTAMRARIASVPRPAATNERIAAQRRSLGRLVTRLRLDVAHAG
ncbi:MAG TPA: hypothetical protein VHM90_11050 [Phycisphaerae bacterium]|jgi:hypothetical protein|nr:hypothetical protein [Phycisphaerae bacterium]